MSENFAFIMDRGKWADTPVASSQHFVLIFRGKTILDENENFLLFVRAAFLESTCHDWARNSPTVIDTLGTWLRVILDFPAGNFPAEITLVIMKRE